MFDSVPDGAEQFVGRDVDEIYADYFQRIRGIAATGLVDCLSHLDLIKIHGHRPCRDVRWIINETLDFGDLWLPLGKAFEWTSPANSGTNEPAQARVVDPSPNTNQVLVAKRWLRVEDILHEWVHHDRNHIKQIHGNVQAWAWPHMGNTQKFSGD